MPEGHSIHRLARAFAALGVGRVVQASSPQGRFARSAALISGTTLVDARARGKHLFLAFDREGANTVHVHLGLYGSWRFVGTDTFRAPTHIGAPRVAGEHLADSTESVSGPWVPPEPRGQVRLRLQFADGVADLSGPATCELIDAKARERVCARLGPDPLVDEADPELFVAAARKSQRPIGALVMDQAYIAGPGNIYRAECLFRVGLSPLRPGNRVSTRRLRALYADLAATMREGVRTGQITTVRPEDVPQPLTDPEAQRFYVYHRAGRDCLRCGRAVKVRDLDNRRLYWCGSCQR